MGNSTTVCNSQHAYGTSRRHSGIGDFGRNGLLCGVQIRFVAFPIDMAEYHVCISGCVVCRLIDYFVRFVDCNRQVYPNGQ